MIRLTIPSIQEDDLQAVREALASGYLVQGARVAAFEQAVASYVGAEFAIAVSNGTAALHLALLALDIQPGDIVIAPAYSWISTANVIELCGAQPVFIDIQSDIFNLDPNRLEVSLKRLMTSVETAPRVKAILPVHTFGQMASMPAIMELAGRYNLSVIEDAACALGATLQGRQAGTWGVMGCFSFHPRKAITTGEGGIITTDNPVLVRRVQALRNHGQDPESPSPNFIKPGFNYRMTEFQAALGLSQMSKLDRIVATRQRLVQHYNELLAGTCLQFPVVAEDSQPVYQSYVVLLPEPLVRQRQAIIQELRARGIETTIGTLHMPLTTYFSNRYGYQLGDFPMTDTVFARSLTLPLFEEMQESQQQEVVKQLLTIVQTKLAETNVSA